MALELQTDVFKIYLEIEDYVSGNRNKWDEQWCHVSLGVTSDFMDYRINTAEILLSCEVDSIIEQIDNLLHRRKTDDVSCIEPDLEFLFFPPNADNDCYGSYMEIRIAFWSKGVLTADSLHICLDEKEATELMNYLITIRN